MLRKSYEEHLVGRFIGAVKSHPNWKERVRNGDIRLLREIQAELIRTISYPGRSRNNWVKRKKRKIAALFRHVQKNLETGKPPFLL